MGEKIIHIYEVLNELPDDINDINHPDSFYKSFIAWNKISQEQLEGLKKIGKILSTIKGGQSNVIGDTYWNTEALIDFTKYPYYGCDLYKSKEGDCYYLIYEEYGGHAPEMRCRLIQRRLIRDDLK